MAVGDYKKIPGKPVKARPKKRAASPPRNMKKQMLSAVGMLMAIVFLPTTFLLFIAMMPTFVAVLVDKAKRKTKAITVGAMNLAGATPFVLELWMQEHSFGKAFDVVTDAKAIIVMYSAAAIGYMIDWAMTGVIAGFLLQRGKARTQAIKKRQKELVERWGREVSGEVAMDEYGFAIKEKEL